VNGGRVKGSKRLELGDRVRIPHFYISSKKNQTDNKKSLVLSESIINNDILYKDDDILAINKPAGISVQGGSKIEHHIDGILEHLQFGLEFRPQLVHRLDKDTSGVLLLARNPQSARRLTLAFKNREIKKSYVALVYGKFPKKNGTIKVPIEQINNKEAKEAVTEYNTLWKGKFKENLLSVVEFIPLTGRKHQLRAHSFHLGCPIVGDKKYKIKNLISEKIKMYITNMCLHAREVGVPDLEGITIRIKAPFPSHILKIFNIINFKNF
jgi:23S rRNA pseudouridine955/2504/2580 synthase